MFVQNEKGTFDYYFNELSQPLAQQNAQRAGFSLFQTYPQNSVQGWGVLTAHNSGSITQPPQLHVSHTQNMESITGSGVQAGTFYGFPLTINPNARNNTGMG